MIEIKDLRFSYGDKKIFDGFSISIPGGITCIAGMSGAGKTTLLRIIAGLEKPQAGTITGVPDKIAYMFQEDRLLSWLTVLGNVEAVLPASKKELAAAALSDLELTDEMFRLPDDLSGGEKRRAALARALAYAGDLVLLDEPFKGLDEALIRRVAALIRSIKAQVIVVTHSPFEIELLGGGKITI